MKGIKYPDRTSTDFDELKSDYKKIYRSDELLDMQSRWDDWKSAHGVRTIPEKVEDIMLADVNDLADIYDRFKALPLPARGSNPRGRKGRSPEYKELYDIFTYTNRFDGRIADFFNERAQQLHISCCYYCEMAYVNTYNVVFGTSSRTRRQFDLDHFIPQKECPILGLSLFNFVPSCQVCNSRVKGGEVFVTSKIYSSQFSPASDSYDFENNVKIRLRMHRGPDTGFRKKGEFYIYFRCKNGYRSLVDFFHLEERYEFHKVEALRLKRLKARYPQSARRKIASLLGLPEANVKEDLFHEHYLKENDRCFAKLTRDMLR